ncbi:MAG TPA: hypothetical protein VLT82_16325 [Myxococcaceae bacterium]|nr:hypothetical protein [Myxococcaceae bacterium]
MKGTRVLALVLSFFAAGCAHYNSQGRAVRVGSVRFDARSVSAPNIVYTLEDDGTWAGMGGDRYQRLGDDLRKVGAFSPTPSLIRPSGWVTIDRRPDGLMYTPSYPGGAIWTFVTEDGRALPADLEIPLYLAAGIGLSGQWIDLHTPASEQAGIPLEADCATVLFDIEGRQVAGFVGRQGTACPEPRYPGREALARLVAARNEVWESPARPLPP